MDKAEFALTIHQILRACRPLAPLLIVKDTTHFSTKRFGCIDRILLCAHRPDTEPH